MAWFTINYKTTGSEYKLTKRESKSKDKLIKYCDYDVPSAKIFTKKALIRE